MKNIVKSRTFWVAVAQALAGVVVVFSTTYPEAGWLVILKSGLDIYIKLTSSSAVNYK